MKNFMKAKAGMLLIAILMIAFTGFGATTADLVQNSTNQITVDFHTDAVTVVTADAVQIQNVVIADSNAEIKTMSVYDVARITSEPETQLQPKETLEVDYFPDGNIISCNWYSSLGNKDINTRPSNRNLARENPPATS